MFRKGSRGFTIVELLVGLSVGSIVLALAYQIFISQRRGYSVQEDVAEMQQNGRIAAEVLAREIKNIGNNVDRENNQAQLLYCGPYELLYSSDLDPSRGPLDVGAAIDSIYQPGTTLHTATTAYSGDAESVLLSLKGNGGRHYDLVRQVFWGNQTSNAEEVALNFNILDTSGNAVPLFTYIGDFDQDGDLEEWAGGGAVVPPAGMELDDVVRRVEIQVLAETDSADRLVSSANSGFRQAVFRSDVTPRNLWDCPSFAAPSDVTQDVTTIEGTRQPYAFEVWHGGKKEKDRTVQFTLSGPGAGTQVTLEDASVETDANGIAVAEINWPTCGAFAVPGPLFLGAGSNLVYDLTATIGEPPPLTTPLGTCAPNAKTLQITVTPGDPDRVVLASGPTPAMISTCSGQSALVFQVQDACQIPVDPDSNSVTFLARAPATGQPVGTTAVDPSFATWSSATSPPFAARVLFSPPSVGAWPTPSPPRASNNFPVEIVAQSPLDTSGATGVVELEPLPSSIVNLTDNIATGTHTDCPSPDASDTFNLPDCHGNFVLDLNGLSQTYTVEPILETNAWSPSNQGSLFSSQNLPGPSIKTPKAPLSGIYEITYSPPQQCDIGPPSGQAVTPAPRFRLELRNGGTTIATEGPHDILLKSCADCSVTADPLQMPLCEGATTVTVSGCDFAGYWVTLEVTSTGGEGSFLPTGIQKTLDLPFPAGPPYQISTTLYIGNALVGDELTVTAHVWDPSNPSKIIWSCASSPIAVSSECNSLTMFTYDENGNRVSIGDQNGETCASRIEELYFEVEDCKYDITLDDAVVVYGIDSNGDVFDVETVDLKATATPFLYESDQPLFAFRDDVSTPGDGQITYPFGKAFTVWAGYVDPTDPNDDHDPKPQSPVSLPLPDPPETCQVHAQILPGLPMCFPNAITSGGGGGWSGNFRVHWGDIVIRGDVELASIPKMIEKDRGAPLNGSPYPGAGNTDRYLDIYVGKTSGGGGGNFLDSGKPLQNKKDPLALDRPFLPGKEGETWSTTHGNYWRNISHQTITAMLAELDYEVLKELAKDRDVYWYTLPGGNVFNPKNPAVPAQGLPLETVLTLPAVGQPTKYHDGQFIFVDTYEAVATDPTTTGADIDATAVFDLPTHTLDNFYTEGIIYIAGSVVFNGGGGGFPIQVATPPQEEIHYLHNDLTWNAQEVDLPIRADPGSGDPLPVTINGVNINGALYMDGVGEFGGSPFIFGAVTAERGYAGNGTPELWYNYHLNVDEENDVFCIDCCTTEMAPSFATLNVGQTAQLNALFATGRLRWSSEDSSIASIVSNGPTMNSATVTAMSVGRTRVRAVDASNCSAWAVIEVLPPCTGIAIDPPNPNGRAGSTQLFSVINADPGSNIVWATDPDPSTIATIGASTGLATAGPDRGPVDIVAHDQNKICPDVRTTFSVNPACAVTAPKTTMSEGETISLSTSNFIGPVTWSSTNPSAATVDNSGNVKAVTRNQSTVITATDTFDGCAASVTITVVK